MLTLRNATPADAASLLVWRNDPATCAASRNTGPVDCQEHQRWLAASMECGDRILLVAERDGVPVGTARWDRLGGDRWELSWTVAPDARRSGVGSAMVRLAVKAHRPPGCAEILADTRAANVPSQRIAERAGLLLEHADGEWCRYRLQVRGPSRVNAP